MTGFLNLRPPERAIDKSRIFPCGDELKKIPLLGITPTAEKRKGEICQKFSPPSYLIVYLSSFLRFLLIFRILFAPPSFFPLLGHCHLYVCGRPAAVPCENFNGWPVSPSFIIFERNCAQKRWNFVNKIDKEQQQLTIKLRLSPYLLKIRRVALKNWVEWHVLSSFNPMLVHCKWQELLP